MISCPIELVTLTFLCWSYLNVTERRWFTIGSILFAVTSVFILVNSFSNTLGEDDSTLDGYHYRATWILMIISGVFCTLGKSCDTVIRARHETRLKYCCS